MAEGVDYTFYIMLSYALTVVLMIGLITMSLIQRQATKRSLMKVDHEEKIQTKA